MTATLSLHEKVVLAAQDAGYVQKSSRNQAQGYQFAGDEAISEKFRDAMLQQGVLVYPTQTTFEEIHPFAREGKDVPNVLVSVRGQFTVTDGKESFTVESLGQGMDIGDKAAYKALTGLKKYAYRNIVMMVTGDDPENAREDEKPARASRSTKKAESKPAEQVDEPGTGNNKFPLGSEERARTDEADPPATQKQLDMIWAQSNKLGLSQQQLGIIRARLTHKASSKDFTNSDIDVMLAALQDEATATAALTGGEVVAE